MPDLMRIPTNTYIVAVIVACLASFRALFTGKIRSQRSTPYRKYQQSGTFQNRAPARKVPTLDISTSSSFPLQENAQPDIEAILPAPTAAHVEKHILARSSFEEPEKDKDSFEQRVRQIRELSEAPFDRMLVQSLHLELGHVV